MTTDAIISQFETMAVQKGTKKALTCIRNGRKETVLSYSQLFQDVLGLTATLHERGLRQGHRVVWLLDKSPIAVAAHMAIQKLGAVGIPLNPTFTQDELRFLLADADPHLIILSPEKTGLIKDILPNVDRLEISTQIPYQELDLLTPVQPYFPDADIGPNDPSLIIYTSGTTGKPKGAILTNDNLSHDAQNIISIWNISAQDVLCHALPLFHVHGLCFALHTALLSGAHIIMLDRFDAGQVLERLVQKTGEDSCTVFMAVPTMYIKMMAAVNGDICDLSHLRLATSGSAPLLIEHYIRIRDTFGVEPVEREGMSETGMNFSNPIFGERKPGSIGLPLPGVQVRIVNPQTGIQVGPGEVGELWLQSPSISTGYWRNPIETEKAFEDGWFKTGGLGRCDHDGYYYLTDRIKHIIISGGENISPKEVETVINQLVGVSESCVVGIPDSKWGQKVVAAIVTTPGSGLSEPDIIAFCKQQLQAWKCPKKILFPDQLPKNTMGKTLIKHVERYFQDDK